MLLLASIAFVGTHFILSHPLRAPLVGAIGEKAFSALYSLVAFATLGWMVVAYRAMPVDAPLWAVGNGLWIAATLLTLVASVLLAGSLIGNPALPNPGGAVRQPGPARGVFAITRHPMLWSFTIWGVAHALVFPVSKTFIVAGAVIVLSLVGAALQDRKKERLQPESWPAWERQTSYLPFAALAAGRARLGSFGAPALVGGTVFWLLATWAHIPLAGWAAGVWRWMV